MVNCQWVSQDGKPRDSMKKSLALCNCILDVQQILKIDKRFKNEALLKYPFIWLFLLVHSQGRVSLTFKISMISNVEQEISEALGIIP